MCIPSPNMHAGVQICCDGKAESSQICGVYTISELKQSTPTTHRRRLCKQLRRKAATNRQCILQSNPSPPSNTRKHTQNLYKHTRTHRACTNTAHAHNPHSSPTRTGYVNTAAHHKTHLSRSSHLQYNYVPSAQSRLAAQRKNWPPRFLHPPFNSNCPTVATDA